MISKELLTILYPIDETSEVYVDLQKDTNRVMYFGKEYKDCRSAINIYEVANTCKEWAFKVGFELTSGIISEDNGNMIFECSIYNKNADTSDTYFITEFEALNEPEAVFRACEYILEQVEKK
jgi:hypothetical protein